MLLPAPVAPTSAMRSPRARVQRHVAQHRHAGLVLEVHVLERDRLVRRAPAGSTRSGGSAGRRHVLLVEELEDALGAGHRALQERVALREQAHRLEELPDVLRERDEQREGDRVVPDPAQPREPEDARDAERAHHLDGRVEHGLVVDGALVGVAVLAVDAVELAAPSRCSRTNAWTTAMPLTCSLRNALRRAVRARTSRYALRERVRT